MSSGLYVNSMLFLRVLKRNYILLFLTSLVGTGFNQGQYLFPYVYMTLCMIARWQVTNIKCFP